MKNGIFLLAFLCSLPVHTQTVLDIGIFNNPLNSNKLEVRIQTDQDVISGIYSAGVFTIRFPVVYGITLVAPSSLNNPLYNYILANQGTDGTYQYYSFGFVSPYIVNWSAGIDYPIAIIQIVPGSGSGNGTFEIINNAWTAANNGDIYQEVNGAAAIGVIYQGSATAPLGMGTPDVVPPTITCPGNQTAATDLNTCHHTHVGASWDAQGNDNFPGFIVRYFLSGATVDTLFTLSNGAFNKGVTTVHAIITDAAGLTADCTFTVTINDTQAPSITAPPALTVMANAASCSAAGVVLATPVSSDNCGNPVITNNAPASFPKGNTTVIWTATDAAGLTATVTQLVTVQSNISATTVNLSTPEICSGNPASLSFPLIGGIAPYSVVYSANGNNSIANSYTSNQPLVVTPTVTTVYTIITATDAIGCSIAPSGLNNTLSVKPKPTLTGISPSSSVVCLGHAISLNANGLLPNASTIFQYSLNGTPATQTVLSGSSGVATFLSGTFSAGNYTLAMNSVTVAGCSTNATVTTTFAVDALSDSCKLSISGKLATSSGSGLKNAAVDLEISGVNIPALHLTGSSNAGGNFGFEGALLPASNAIIKPYKNDNHLNGVTTFDLVQISKHILGLQTLNDPYKIIAADANHSNLVTTADIVELRKLILGIYDELPSNTSWRFVDKAFVFSDPANPLSAPFPEQININNILTNHTDADFVAVKIGDVNGTVIANAIEPGLERSTDKVFLEWSAEGSAQNGPKTSLTAGETFTLHFQTDIPVTGLQYTLEFDGLDIVEIIPGEGMYAENFALFPNALTTSFFTLDPAQAHADFDIRFQVRSAGLLTDMIHLSGNITAAEAYINSNPTTETAFKKTDIQLRQKEIAVDKPGFVLYQNQPNPFSENTSIRFYLPENEWVTITIFDEMGRLVFIHRAQFPTGDNSFLLDGTQVPAAGILFYKVQTLDNSAVRKMVKG